MGFGLFGGNLSVRKPRHQKPLMIFGQDESVFNQFLLKPKQWVAPLGQRALLPKTEGMSLMISAFQSRETGFGVQISRIQLEEINEARRGQNYVDLDAALAVHGQVAKKDLKESPFVGHAKKLTGGLDAYRMNKSYGGAQPLMRESKIKDHDGYLGMHERTLQVGDTQSFVFTSDDEGPFWMSPEKRELNRHDRLLSAPPGTQKLRNKTIAELKSELNRFNVLSNRHQYCLTELQQIARDNNIDPRVERTRDKKGWIGRPKDLLQVLWEQGWINTNQIDKYTMDIPKDDDGAVVEGAENWSLKYLMASCLDFAEEMTALQRVGHTLGVSVLITLKFHAGMAGEGIEYSWGVAKSIYCKMPLNSKKGKASFKVLVNECASRDILTTGTVRKLSRRARSYICAYYTLHQHKLLNKNGDNNTPALTLPLIECLMKAFKTHRAAVDFDAGFVNSFVSPAIAVMQAILDNETKAARNR